MMKAPYVSLVNLLAGAEIFPDFLTRRCPAQAMADRILTWLDDPAELAQTRRRLQDLKDKVAIPGACERAAEYIAAVLRARSACAAA
jgi:lipid-A-disaccharide synthase